MKQSISHFVTLYVLAWMLVSSAQVPTLDPEKTVNPATGEMSFALPLGTVDGGNDLFFPVNLNYKAGILYHQEASPAGLGFSYGPGGITRKVVFVPDDAIGGSQYTYHPPREESQVCKDKPWKQVVAYIIGGIVLVLSVALSIITAGTEAGLAIMVVTELLSLGSTMLTAGLFQPFEYSAGGAHTTHYKVEEENGAGYFRGGHDTDLPDVYFVNTPYWAGELIWVGGSPEDGYFCPKQVTGTGADENATVDVDYKPDNTFVITLANGTRLFFEKRTRWPEFNYTQGIEKSGDIYCNWQTRLERKDAVTQIWHLTKVLGSDYYDGNEDMDPTNSEERNEGSWVTFDYITKRSVDYYRPGPDLQSSPTSSTSSRVNNWTMVHNTHSGGTTEETVLHWISSAKGPTNKANYVYEYDRKDNLWHKAHADGSSTKLTDFPRLHKIQIVAGSGTVRKTIVLDNDSYRLKPHSFHSGIGSWNQKSLSGNPSAGVLTLEALKLKGENEKDLAEITFGYVQNNPNHMNREFEIGRNRNSNNEEWYVVDAYLEERDIWGYFTPNGSANENDFNVGGSSTKAAYADAWSLNSVSLPTGMTVGWVYEANRYDKVNNVGVSSTGNEPKYGGGIRVKKVKIGDAVSKDDRTISFFYTDMTPTGSFEETATNGTSGHATAEPYPYHLKDDPRTNKARGGLYTGAKVTYERTIAAEDYDYDNKTAPRGYTVYDYWTPADKDCQNKGYYGEYDNSYRRGMLKSVRQYNSDNEMVTSQSHTYQVEAEGALGSGLTLYDGANISIQEPLIQCGVVRLKETVSEIDDVAQSTQYTYSDELNQTNDEVTNTSKPILSGISNSPNTEASHHNGSRCNSSSYKEFLKGAACQVFAYGDPDLPDLFVVSDWNSRCGLNEPPFDHMFTHEARLRLIVDVDGTRSDGKAADWSYNTLPVLYQYKNAKNAEYSDPEYENEITKEYTILGITAGFYNENSEIDVAIFYKLDREPNTSRLKIIYDISLDNAQMISSKSEVSKSFSVENGGIEIHNKWTDCTFGSIDGGTDMVCVKAGDYHPFFVGLDFDPNTPTIFSSVHSARTLDEITSKAVMMLGNRANIALRGNDLVITHAQEHHYRYRNKQDYKEQYRIVKELFKDIEVDKTTGEIKHGAGPRVGAAQPEKYEGEVATIAVTERSFGDRRNYKHLVDALYTEDSDEEILVLQNSGKLSVAIYKEPQLRDRNGLPEKITKVYPEQSKVSTLTRPAYLDNPGMKTKHLLTQTGQKTVKREHPQKSSSDLS